MGSVIYQDSLLFEPHFPFSIQNDLNLDWIPFVLLPLTLCGDGGSENKSVMCRNENLVPFYFLQGAQLKESLYS